MQATWEAKGQKGSNTAGIVAKQVPKSYYLNISITIKKSRAFNESTPKVRIKIPKLLVKTVKKKQHHKNATDHKISNKNSVKKLRSQKILFPKHVNSLFSNVIPSCKKSSVKNSRNPSRNVEEYQSRRVTEDMFTKTAWEDSVWSESTSSTISLKSGNRSFSHPPKICDILEFKEEEYVNPFGFNPQHAEQTITTYKPPSSKVEMTFKGFFNKRTPFNFIKSKSSSSSSSNSKARKGGRGIGSKEEVYCKSSLMIETAKEEEGDCQELCKKKILLGERCRPLNFTGILHYDKLIRTVNNEGYPTNPS